MMFDFLGRRATSNSSLHKVYLCDLELDDDDILRLANECIDLAESMMRENAREWTNLNALVGFQVGRVNSFFANLTNDQYDKLVMLVCCELGRRDTADMLSITGGQV